MDIFKRSSYAAVLRLGVSFILVAPLLAHPITFEFWSLAHVSFSSWRPYSNPNRLVSVGMNKGEVLAIAGKPDHEESYYQSSGRRLLRISDWYYVRTGHTPESTILKFTEETLVSITSTPTR